MKKTLIIGAQGSGKTTKLIDLLENVKHIHMDADELNSKHCLEGLVNGCTVAIEGVRESHIARIKSLLQGGQISYRPPYQQEAQTFTIDGVIMTTCDEKLAKYFREDSTIIKL